MNEGRGGEGLPTTKQHGIPVLGKASLVHIT